MSFVENNFFALNSQGWHRIVFNEWGDRDGRLLLAVHGLTCNGHDFDDLARVLSEDGYRVIAVDLPGRGRSDYLTQPYDYHLHQYALDISHLIAHLGLQQSEGIDWLGTSLGGLLGIYMASLHNTPVRRLIVNDVAPEIAPEIMDFLYNIVLKPRVFDTMQELEADMRQIQRIGWGPLTDMQWQNMARYYARALPDGRLTYAYDPALAENFAPSRRSAVSLWPCWEKIRARTLLIRGGQSMLLTQAVAEQMCAGPGPNPDFIQFDDCAHAPSLLAPVQIGTIRQWLSTTPTS
ncbi:MAG: alpha/beta hydrolase [Alphaproteobacteria bacterium]|nr:alpha/beta hydrolase [Alphaproteobacteria bacterium]